MTPVIAFMLANYAFRPLDYRRDSWTAGEQATSAYFQPIATFGERFEAYLADVREIGFTAVDLWQPMLDVRWLTDDHLDAAADLLSDYGLRATSFAGWLGASDDEFEQNCETAAALGAPLLTGDTNASEAYRVEALRKYGLKWGYENEPEPTPEALLHKIGASDTDVVGACVDTGWFGTHGYDAADALQALAPRLFHVHLKDVRRAGAHESCRYGTGIVPVERCARVLKAIGYSGAISIEHETSGGDPTEDCIANLHRLKEWLL